MKILMPVLLLLGAPCSAETGSGTDRSTARLDFRVAVPPVFRVLRLTAVAGGHEYRVWTNMKSIAIGGREYRFNHVGEATVFVSSSTAPIIVHGL